LGEGKQDLSQVSETIVIIGVVQALFGMVIFMTKRPTHKSFSFLTVWFAVISIFLGSFLLPFEVVDYFKPGIFPLLFLFGPLLYLYVSSLTLENFKVTYRQLWHLIPFLAISIHRSTISVVPIVSPVENPLYVYNKVYYFLLILTLLFYWVLSLNLILKHRKLIPLQFSNYTRNNSLSWLILVLTLFLVFFLVDFVLFFIKMVWHLDFLGVSLLPLNLTTFVLIMIFFGINQSVIYLPTTVKEKDNDAETNPTPSAIDADEVNTLNEIIVNYLTNKKPYLNPEYNLQMMAVDLAISKHKLSRMINIGQNKNFYKLINEYRIREVKKMLVDPAFAHFSILGIAYECGFNSKTAFNRIFKEETGLTPSEYKSTI
jgi:AraC-like DNA-binding protein